jgi:DNA-binding MarR family transcriptional regulator
MSTKRKNSSEEAGWLTLDEMKMWRVLHEVMTGLPIVLGDELRREVGLSFLEYYVLAGLSEQPSQSLRMSQLALLANSELSRLSHLVGRLEKRGLVRRRPDPTDGRFNLAVLTSKGRKLVIQAAPLHVRHVRQLIFDVLDESEQRAVFNALLKVRGTIIGQLLDRSPGLLLPMDL